MLNFTNDTIPAVTTKHAAAQNRFKNIDGKGTDLFPIPEGESRSIVVDYATKDQRTDVERLVREARSAASEHALTARTKVTMLNSKGEPTENENAAKSAKFTVWNVAKINRARKPKDETATETPAEGETASE